MSGQEHVLGEKAAEFRKAFDRSFANAPYTDQELLEDFLAIRVGSDPYAVHISEVAGLYADKTLIPLPSPVHGLIGITGVRGAILPVYDLRALCGCPAGAKPRWLMIAAKAFVGLAFDALEGHLRVAQTSSASAETAKDTPPYVRGVLRAGDVVRPVVQVATFLEEIKQRAKAEAIQEDRA